MTSLRIVELSKEIKQLNNKLEECRKEKVISKEISYANTNYGHHSGFISGNGSNITINKYQNDLVSVHKNYTGMGGKGMVQQIK